MEFAVQTRGSYDTILTAARWAERRKLSAIALPDHYLPVLGDASGDEAFDHFIHFAALARDTETLDLVCLVAPVTLRHPAVLYKIGVTLDELSNGRFTMGVGTGWYEEEFELFGIDYPSERERLERREEALAYLAAAIAPEARGFAGEYYTLSKFDPQPHPENLRLAIGGGGMVKTPRVAGMYADEFNIYACPPEDFLVKVERTREAAEKAGRDPDDILITSAGPAIAGPTEADYVRLRDNMAELTGVDPGRIDSGYEKRRYPHGYGEKPAEMIAALEEVGCQRYYLQMFAGGPDDYDMILDTYQG